MFIPLAEELTDGAIDGVKERLPVLLKFLISNVNVFLNIKK